jgi:hypothetical protein
LATKLLGQRPPHSIGDEPALDPKNYVPQEGYSARRTDVAADPSSGGRVRFEEARERCTALPRIDVQRPARARRRSPPPAGVHRSQAGLPGAVHRTKARLADTAFRQCAGTLRARPRRSNAANRLRTPGQTQVGAPRAGAPGSTAADPFPGRTKGPTPAHGWTRSRSREGSSRGWSGAIARRAPGHRRGEAHMP